MEDSLKIFLTDMQSEFLAGNLESLIDRFAKPLVVYSIAGVAVFRTREEILARASQYRAALLSLSVATSQVKILSRDVVVNNRLRATVRVVDFDSDDREVTGSLVRYFLIDSDGTYRIEMIEYLEAPLPQEEVERLVH